MVRQAAAEEFSEDNYITLKSFLEEQFSSVLCHRPEATWAKHGRCSRDLGSCTVSA
jgi:hypothetical protein